jgi:uncharacterized protein (TIGR02001 family)
MAKGKDASRHNEEPAAERAPLTFGGSREMIKYIGKAMIVLSLFAPLAAQAQEAEVSANAGWVSQYYYRGLLQKTSSASAGLDVAVGGLYLGTWAADVGDGAEVDLYAGFGVDVNDMVSLSAGGTGYFYSGQFDDTYLEANLGLGLGPISFEYSFGTYENFDEESLDYSFVGVTAEHEGLFATVGAFGTDLALEDVFDAGQYLEAGYGFSAADLDFSISGIWNDSQLSGEVDEIGEDTNELTLVFGVSKTFELN